MSEEPMGETAPEPMATPEKSSQTLTWVLAGVASVAVLLAAVFGVKAFSKDDTNADVLNASANGPATNGDGMVRMFGNAGKITKIDGKKLTLQTTGFNNETSTVLVATDDDTKFADNVKGSLADLKVGQTVLANGTTTDGVMTAERISPADVMRRRSKEGEAPPPFAKGQAPRVIQGGADGSFAAGEITKIDGDTLTIKDPAGTTTTIKTTASTNITVTKTIKLSDLKVGDTVGVGGETKDDVLQAESVTRGELMGGPTLFRGGPGGPMTQSSGSNA